MYERGEESLIQLNVFLLFCLCVCVVFITAFVSFPSRRDSENVNLLVVWLPPMYGKYVAVHTPREKGK